MLDLIIVIFLAMGAYSGYKQGLFISILSIVAFIIAIILAFHFMDWGTTMLAERVDQLTFFLPFVAFLMIFLGVILIIRGLAYLVKKTMDFTILGSVDSVAGGILGIFKTAFILSLFLWVANSFEFFVPKEWVEDSKSYSYIQPIAPFVIMYLDQFTPIIKDTIAGIQELVKLAADGAIDR
jgi:membrane protein required for colicin V production